MLTDFDIPVDQHTIRATDMILGWISGVKDRQGRKIYESAKRIGTNRKSVFTGESVYALLRIMDQTDTVKSLDGVVLEKRVECLLDLVFQVPALDEEGSGVDIQAWADGLLEWTKLHLQPIVSGNPLGYTPVHPMIFDWSRDMDFHAKLGRGVTLLDGQPAGLAGRYYTIPYQFKIDVFVTLELD